MRTFEGNREGVLREIAEQVGNILERGDVSGMMYFNKTNRGQNGKQSNPLEVLRTSNGIVYGWAQGNTIHLTKAGLNPNTPVHEFTHLWAKAMQINDPKFWAECKAELMKSSEWQEVLNDENYANIRGNEDAVASEVFL